MATMSVSSRPVPSFAKFGRARTYGAPRHANAGMLNDIGLSPDDLGVVRKR